MKPEILATALLKQANKKVIVRDDRGIDRHVKSVSFEGEKIIVQMGALPLATYNRYQGMMDGGNQVQKMFLMK